MESNQPVFTTRLPGLETDGGLGHLPGQLPGPWRSRGLPGFP